MSEVPSEVHGLHTRVVVVEVPQNVGRPVRPPGVHEDDLEIYLLAPGDSDDLPVELGGVALLVQPRDHDGEHHTSRIIVRTRKAARTINRSTGEHTFLLT